MTRSRVPGCIASAVAILSVPGTVGVADGPPDPTGSAPAPAPWGDPVNGLRVRLGTGARSVLQGARIDAEISFRGAGATTGSPPGLIRDSCVESWELVLRDVTTGEVHERAPHEGRSIGHFHSCTEIVELPAGVIEAARAVFPLVGISGEQVPAGVYETFVRYRNEGDSRAYPVAEECDTAGDLSAAIWSGTAESGRVTLRVLPVDADTTRRPLPVAIRVFWDESRGAVRWEWSAWEEVELVRPPGFLPAFVCEVTCESTDPAAPLPADAGRTSRFGGSLPAPDDGVGHFVTGRSAKEPPSVPIRVTLHARVYSEPRASGRLPTDPPGVLWERTITAEGP